jgi:hypothetical protein
MSLNYIKEIALLGGIFVLLPTVLFFVLRRLARPLIRGRAATSNVNREITPTGYIVYGLQVLFLVVCTAAYNLDPQGRLGSLLHSTDGVVVAICIAVFGVGIAEALLRQIGYPLVRVRDDRNA